MERADYYIFDFYEVLHFRDNKSERERCEQLLESEYFQLISHIDGLLLFRKDTVPGNRRMFNLERTGPIVPDSTAFEIRSREILPAAEGYIMSTEFLKGGAFTKGEALISFLIDTLGGDTVRVLHTPSYIAAKMDDLEPGVYREQFFFQVPGEKSIKDRKHEVRLYWKSTYLPFFDRKEYLVKTFY
jgi:hypothetical protein